MKLAWVVPRWSEAVRGGAEYGARMVAERLARLDGWDVEVYTTGALDHFTWADELPPGDEVLNGVLVHRFPCEGRRYGEDPGLVGRVLRNPRLADVGDARRWVELQGPTSPELLDAVRVSPADVVVFKPYLFAPTVQGVPKAGGRAVMYPAAHDEPLLRLPAYRDTFRETEGFIFNTHEERRLVERVFRVAEKPRAVLGLGVDPPPVPLDDLPSPRVEGLDGRPYVVSVGRVEEGKGARLLTRFFQTYKRRNPGPLALVLAGGGERTDAYASDDVVVPGPVDEATKWALFAHARAFASASPYESFSIVLMEAWHAGLPALVNGSCAVMRGHVQRSGGGVAFDDYPAFEAALRVLEASAEVRDALGARGNAYLRSRYSWDVLIPRYAAFLEEMADRARRKPRG